MVAGLAALDVINREDVSWRGRRKSGNAVGEGLRALMPKYEFLKDVRAGAAR